MEESENNKKKDTPTRQVVKSALGFMIGFLIFAGFSFGVYKITGLSERIKKEDGYHAPGKTEKVEITAAETAYISNYLELTTKQSQEFWPLYNQYIGEWAAADSSLSRLHETIHKHETNNSTHTGITADLAGIFSEKASIINDYSRKFKKILPNAAAKVFIAHEKYIESAEKDNITGNHEQ